MTTLPASLKFTYDEYCAFPEDGKRHELIDGDHYVTPAPLTKHQRIVANLHRLIGPVVHEHSLGTVLFAPVDVLLSHVDVVQPDFLFVSKARTVIITESNIQGAPDLVVEILSESTRKNDEGIKRLLYERAQVQEYWIIDPVAETIKIYRLHDGHYATPDEVTSTSPTTALTTPILPGLSISLSEIFS
jgi:Uma2 family endonuclease